MKKLWLIVKREYLTRVRKRSFIIATIVTPLAFVLLFVVVGIIFSYKGDKVKRIAVVDEAGLFTAESGIADTDNIHFLLEKERPLDSLRLHYEEEDLQGILYIPPVKNLYASSHTIYYYAAKSPTLEMESAMREQIGKYLRKYKIKQLGLDEKALKAIDSKVSIEPEPINEEVQDRMSKLAGAIGAGIGSIMGIIMYMAVFIYGSMVMRSVMEEKTNRIVEVMISSVRPFQLMMGKIIGVGAVGLTQLAIWAVLIPLLTSLAGLFFNIEPPQTATGTGMPEIDPAEMEGMMMLAVQEIRSLNWWFILPSFLLYFIGGYFLYASLFAAVGSAMGDDLGESQSLTIPISIPVLLAFYIMFATVESPDSSLAVWSSLFPLFSPIVMPARLAFQPPVWQVLASIALLLATSVFFIWLSGRIYRIAILSYGKKASWKTMIKWVFSKV